MMKKLLLGVALSALTCPAYAQFATTTTTAPVSDNTTRIASTAFVIAQIAAGTNLVNSVTNSDGTLSISPTTGAVVASLNLAHANPWSALQTFNGGIAGASATNASLNISGTQSLPGNTNGAFVNAVYGSSGTPITVPSLTASGIDFTSFFTTSGDRGNVSYTHFFNQLQLNGGQGGNFYGTVSLAQASGTWTPTGLGGISGVIGSQMGAVSSRGGYVFGGNPYCTVTTTAATSCVGMEIDVDNRVATTDVIGFQIIGISTNTGVPGGINTGILLANQSGSNPWTTGIQISAGHGVFPVGTSGTGIQLTGGTVTFGIDMTGLTCSSACIKTPGPVAIGSLASGFQFVVDRSDSTLALFAGTTKGMRITNTAANTALEGVDSSGVGSFQPLALNGTTVEVQTSGTRTALFNTAAHVSYVNGVAPTLTAGCNGAGSSVSGNDVSGTVTGQTAAATTCTLTFGTAYAAAPNCTASGLSSPLTGAITTGTGTLVVNFASTANFKWSYSCFGA
jgi:hypothetical protein